MPTATLLRWAALAAMIGGALRIVSAFVPYQTPPPLALELFYLVIDVNLLCGLVGIYAWVHRSAGATGFAGFLLAFLGTALIVGPDGKLGALDVYTTGALMIALGVALLALGGWRRSRLPRAAAVLWLLSSVVGVGGFIAGGLALTFAIAGVAFGLAFIVAGVALWSEPVPQ